MPCVVSNNIIAVVFVIAVIVYHSNNHEAGFSQPLEGAAIDDRMLRIIK